MLMALGGRAMFRIHIGRDKIVRHISLHAGCRLKEAVNLPLACLSGLEYETGPHE